MGYGDEGGGRGGATAVCAGEQCERELHVEWAVDGWTHRGILEVDGQHQSIGPSSMRDVGQKEDGETGGGGEDVWLKTSLATAVWLHTGCV